VTEPVSVIVPAYNESAAIEAPSDRSSRRTHPLEVIVVDDARPTVRRTWSNPCISPRTSDPAAERGQADRAQHRAAGGTVRPDRDGRRRQVFETDAVRMLVQRSPTRRRRSVPGTPRSSNRGGLLGRWQHIEYVIGFNLDRRCSTWRVNADRTRCRRRLPAYCVERIGGLSDVTACRGHPI